MSNHPYSFEEEELRCRHEAGDIIHGDDPACPPLFPRGNGYWAQLFWAIHGPLQPHYQAGE